MLEVVEGDEGDFTITEGVLYVGPTELSAGVDYEVIVY
jgi:hypothetical protein